MTAGFLATLKQDELDGLLSRGSHKRFDTGAPLFHAGESSDWIAVVLIGRVKISYFTEDGREIVLAVRGPGELLGELSAIDGAPRSASAYAVEPVEALVVTAEQFRDFIATNPRIGLDLLRMLSLRLRDADRKRIEFGAYDTEGRVARRLVELAEEHGEASGTGVRITLPLSQDELAGWTGASREAVSKALRALRERGWIATHRRGVTVLDVKALRERVT